MSSTNKNFIIPIIIGLCIISVSQLAAHYINLPDFVYGGLTGLGFGIMILGIYRKNINPVH